MRCCQHREHRVSKRTCQLCIIPHHDSTLRAAKCFPCRSCHHHSPFSQRILKLTASDQAQLMSSIKEDVAIPLCNDVANGPDGKGEQGHRGTQSDHPGAHQRGYFAEEVKVNFKFDRIERNVNDLQTTYPCWPVDTVAGMPSERLGDAHDNVARLG